MENISINEIQYLTDSAIAEDAILVLDDKQGQSFQTTKKKLLAAFEPSGETPNNEF